MRYTRLFFLLSPILLLSGCGVGEREVIVESCGEPIEISDCKWKGQLFTCVIENKGDVIFAGVPVWKYDEAGVLLEKTPYRYAAGLKPNASVRQKLPVTKFNKDSTAKVIFCRTDPQSPPKK